MKKKSTKNHLLLPRRLLPERHLAAAGRINLIDKDHYSLEASEANNRSSSFNSQSRRLLTIDRGWSMATDDSFTSHTRHTEVNKMNVDKKDPIIASSIPNNIAKRNCPVSKTINVKTRNRLRLWLYSSSLSTPRRLRFLGFCVVTSADLRISGVKN